MRLYRVAPVDPAARPGTEYHPGFVPPSLGGNRIDNPDRYDTLYLSTSAPCAVAEAFGTFPRWGPHRVEHPKGFTRQLATFELPGQHPILDLDDAPTLVRRGVGPSRVVTRDRGTTQAWAAAAFDEGRWAGISWWSFYEPDWTTCGIWCSPGSGRVTDLHLVDLQPIEGDSEAVVVACDALGRPWI